MKFETASVHAGMKVDSATGAVAPPIHLSTTFEAGADGLPVAGYVYVRDANPTQDQLELALAAIDRGAASLVFASGLAATAALLQALPPGSHVVLPVDSYYGLRAMAREYMSRWGLTATLVDTTDLAALRTAVTPATRVVWIETPGNPSMSVTDIAAAAAIAHGAGAILVVDGTFATPALQRPIEHGADVVMHSTTKYLGGHSDVQGGSLTFKERGELFDSTLEVRTIVGGVASPFNSWLVLRGIRSLAARMRVHSENGQRVAEYLAAHPRVEAVLYPGLASHRGHAIARKQMSAFGGMLSFLYKGSREETLAVVARTKLFTRATSLGGVESLIEHRFTSEGPGSTTPENLVRVSVGLENADDLVADLASALD